MLETLITIILLPFAFGAVVLTGALVVATVKAIFKRNK